MRFFKRFRAFLFMTVCLIICSVQAVQVICAVNIRGGGSTTVTYDAFLSNDDILSVYQPINSEDPKWTKYGHNATLNANATKIETTSAEALQSALTNKDSEGNADLTKINASLTYGTDDYTKASTPVYGKIDIVNVDIKTGEIIGKLSDPTYNFEWFGRDVTISAGTMLASGRTLTADTTFTVDCYTYYPTMYIRRCIIDNNQWLSVSEKDFAGSVEVPGYYTATFTATVYNPDKTLAKNSNGVIVRSYINNDMPLSYYKSAYLNEFYSTDYSTENNVNITTQERMLLWCTNLTKAWKTAQEDATLQNYTCAKSCQGEGYTAFVYNYLYLIKYADNNAQEMVGDGNCRSSGKYNAITNANGSADNAGEDETLTATINGKEITYGKKVTFAGTSQTRTYSVVNYLESMKSGGTIGMEVSNANGGNEAGLLYGYKVNYVNTTQNGYTEKEGLYTTQFLTHTASGKRALLDGYVGSNGYTSVMCLGVADPWANMFTWVFGMAVLNNTDDPNRGESEAKINIYATTENYNYKTNNWIVNNYSGTGADAYEAKISALSNAGYHKLSYNLPTAQGVCRMLGVTDAATQENLKDALIGLPSANSGVGSRTKGLCDYYYPTGNQASQYFFGVLRGGAINNGVNAGPFCVNAGYTLANCLFNVGLRSALVG